MKIKFIGKQIRKLKFLSFIFNLQLVCFILKGILTVWLRLIWRCSYWWWWGWAVGNVCAGREENVRRDYFFWHLCEDQLFACSNALRSLTLRMRRMTAIPDVAMTLALLGTRFSRVGMTLSAAWSNLLPRIDDKYLAERKKWLQCKKLSKTNWQIGRNTEKWVRDDGKRLRCVGIKRDDRIHVGLIYSSASCSFSASLLCSTSSGPD